MSIESNYTIDEFIDFESINQEYKQFTFNLGGLNIDLSDAEELCKTNKFYFNNQIILNLEEYFKFFCPKYLSGFFNAKISGQLFIGPDDWGIIKGIPYQGILPTQLLSDKFYKHLNLKIYNKNFSGNIKDFVKIKFIKINYPQDKIDYYYNKINPFFIKYLEEKDKHEQIMKLQYEEFNNWKIRYSFVQQKLVNLLNNYESRILIINYIKLNSSDPSAISIIKLLESNQKILTLNNEQIAEIVTDKNNPYHWVSEWKEHMCKVLQKERPKFIKTNFSDFNAPFNLINSVTNMIPYWLSNNPNMNLYLVQIDFNYNNHIMEQLGKWYHLNSLGNWISCKRVIKDDGEPANFPDE